MNCLLDREAYADNRLFYNNYDLAIYLFFSLLFLSTFLKNGLQLSDLSPKYTFSLFLIVIGILTFMPLNYSPLRYTLFMIPFIIILFIYSIKFLNIKLEGSGHKITAFILASFSFWLLLVDTIILIFYRNNYPIRMLCWGTLPFALGLAYTFNKYINIEQLRRKNILIGMISILVFGGLALNIYRFNEPNMSVQNYTISEASVDLAKVLNDGAVLTGMHAPVLVSNNEKLQAYIHQFTLLNQPSNLFDKNPITHIALPESERKLALQYYPKLKNATPIVTYWLNDIEVVVYYIGTAYNNERIETYEPSSYEWAMYFELQGKSDSAYIAVHQFTQAVPDSKSANLLKAQLLMKMGKYDESLNLINQLIQNYPTDSHVIFECARTVHYLSVGLKDKSLYEFAQTLYEKGVTVNPYRHNYAQRLYQNIESQFK